MVGVEKTVKVAMTVKVESKIITEQAKPHAVALSMHVSELASTIRLVVFGGHLAIH